MPSCGLSLGSIQKAHQGKFKLHHQNKGTEKNEHSITSTDPKLHPMAWFWPYLLQKSRRSSHSPAALWLWASLHKQHSLPAWLSTLCSETGYPEHQTSAAAAQRKLHSPVKDRSNTAYHRLKKISVVNSVCLCGFNEGYIFGQRQSSEPLKLEDSPWFQPLQWRWKYVLHCTELLRNPRASIISLVKTESRLEKQTFLDEYNMFMHIHICTNTIFPIQIKLSGRIKGSFSRQSAVCKPQHTCSWVSLHTFAFFWRKAWTHTKIMTPLFSHVHLECKVVTNDYGS